MVLEVPFYISMKTIAFYNFKGGVGKSTSSLAFAHILSNDYGMRVLLVDSEKQGNATENSGLDKSEGLTCADLLVSKQIIIEDTIKKTEFGYDIITANKSLEIAESEIRLDLLRPQQTRLRKQLNAVKDKYDYCIIDCSNNINTIVMNDLVAADEILIPIDLSADSVSGFDAVSELMNNVYEWNDKIHIKGCFITMAVKNTNLTKELNLKLASDLGSQFFKQNIRHTVYVKQSTYNHCPLTAYKPAKKVTEDYRKLVAEYLALD